jgi:CRP-like cAMP-binding protein
LALGFFTILFSNFVPSIQFGYLSAFVMIYALLTDLFVNPVILLWVQLITLWDYVTLKFKKTVLEQSLIFKNLRYSEAKKVVLLGSIRKASADEHIFYQDEKGEEMFLILSGRVRVVMTLEQGREKILDTLEQGDLFGEMALLGEGTRTASVIAETDTELLKIDFKSLERVRHRNPGIAAKLYMNIARILTKRVLAQNIAYES